MSRPILVTGLHRSGTTWVGKMLAASNSLRYIHEPFNLYHHQETTPLIEQWFTYICNENSERYKVNLPRFLGMPCRSPAQFGSIFRRSSWKNFQVHRQLTLEDNKLNRRLLIKDPLAYFSSEWLAKSYDMDVLILIRHPAAFAASLKQQNWDFPFIHFLQQPLLMNKFLRPFELQIQQYANSSPDIIDQAILLWRIFIHVLERFKAHHPEWLYVTHESISSKPVTIFEKIFSTLDIEFTEDIRLNIIKHSKVEVEGSELRHDVIQRDSYKNVNAWRVRLKNDEVERIHSELENIASCYYDADTW